MSVALSSKIEVIPSGGACGAELKGVDVSRPLSPEAKNAVKQALFAHGVVCLRNQKITDEQLVAFGRGFSDLHAYPVTEYEKPAGLPPEVELISNILVDGKPIGALGSGEAVWHSDMSMFDVPASFTYLYAEKVPQSGGNTRFANLYAAYDALPDALKQKIEGRKSIHDIAYIADGRLRPPYKHVTDKSKGPGAQHPIVRTHPESGRKALYLGRKGYGYIFGYPVPESDALLDTIWDHMTSPKFVWEHEWRVGDVLIWDNRGVAHSRGTIDPTLPRLMRRIVGMGERPV